MAERGRGPGMMAPPTMGRLRAGITDTVLWQRSMSLAGSAYNPVLTNGMARIAIRKVIPSASRHAISALVETA